MFNKIRSWLRRFRVSMRVKISLGLCAIAISLLLCSIISFFEYNRMSSYVSSLIKHNVNSIDDLRGLSKSLQDYNSAIFLEISNGDKAVLPAFNQKDFVYRCTNLHKTLNSKSLNSNVDTLLNSYSDYMHESLNFEQVSKVSFNQTTKWYFNVLQQKYYKLTSDFNVLYDGVYKKLQDNSSTFERGFYRSVIPGTVAVIVGICLVLLLWFFILVYYANPIVKMLSSLSNYRSYDHKYKYDFEGDDELFELNTGIKELANENQQLRRRIKEFKKIIEDNKQ